MGYLLCGPVGTGKTFLVECLAGEAGVPVVKLKNFRDRWVGSSEGNLEKIFRLVRALGRCMVFVDEADQALGRRESGERRQRPLGPALLDDRPGDVATPATAGASLWILASSRPDLIEVDLKRPGRVDVKVPAPADQHARRERAARRRRSPGATSLGARRRSRRAPRGAHADAADPRRRRGARREGLPPRAHRRTSPPAAALEALPRGLPEPGARRRARVPDAARRSARRPTSPSCPPAFRRLADAGRHAVSGRRSYLAAAFNARPFGMPMPPNWFGVAAFGLLGALVDPGFWLIGAGRRGALPLCALAERALPRGWSTPSGAGVRGMGRALRGPRRASRRRGAECAGRSRAALPRDRRAARAHRRERVADRRRPPDGLAAPQAAGGARARSSQVIAAADRERRGPRRAGAPRERAPRAAETPTTSCAAASSSSSR